MGSRKSQSRFSRRNGIEERLIGIGYQFWSVQNRQQQKLKGRKKIEKSQMIHNVIRRLFERKKLLAILIAIVIILPAIILLTWDSDGDGLWDSHENQIGTDPHIFDTDNDGLSDSQEVYGVDSGFKTDPLVMDTDDDGLNDYEETIVYASNPLKADTDGDGALDSVDLTPNGYPKIVWRKEFDPGLIRSSLVFSVFSIRGIYAETWEYNIWSGLCELKNEDTEGATKSSEVTRHTVMETVNLGLNKEGDAFFQATDANYLGGESKQFIHKQWGNCDLIRPKYKIGYEISEDEYEVSFQNVVPAVLKDNTGSPFWFTYRQIPVELNRQQIVSLQFQLRASMGTPTTTTPGPYGIPGFAFALYKEKDFSRNQPILETVAPSSHLGNNTYQVDITVDPATASLGNVLIDESGYSMVLVASPVWVETEGGKVNRALNPSFLNIAAINRKSTSRVVYTVAKLGLNVAEITEAIPNPIESYPSGLHQFGSIKVCITKSASSAFCANPTSEDAIVLVSDSLVGLQEAKEKIDWGQPELWSIEQNDEFGNVLKTFNDFLDVLEIDLQLIDYWGETLRQTTSARVQVTEVTVALIQVRANPAGEKEYTSLESELRREREWKKGIGAVMVSIRTRTRFVEVVRNPRDTVLSKNLGESLRISLKAARIGTVLVSNGREAWLAYTDGDSVQGSIYVVRGGVDTFSTLAKDRTLGSFGIGVRLLKRVPAATLAKIALGIISSGYAVSRIAGATNEFDRRVLANQAMTGTLDLFFCVALSMAPIYLGWSLGVTIAHALVPNEIAAKVMSSPASFVIFIWTSFFTDSIPKEYTENAYDIAKETAVEATRNANAAGQPSIAILP